MLPQSNPFFAAWIENNDPFSQSKSCLISNFKMSFKNQFLSG